MSKPNIYLNISENSGVGYYRQFLLADALRELGLANVLINDFTYGESRIFCKTVYPDCEYIERGYEAPVMVENYCKHLEEVHKETPDKEVKEKITSSIVGMVEPNVETLTKIGAWADIIVFGRRDVGEYLSQWGGLRDFYNIPIVVDTDDNVHATRPFNPGYRGYYPGAPSLEWNKKTMQEVNAVTVSTENLKNVHLRDNSNIYVVPNSLEFDRWNKAPKPEHEEIRIGMLLSSAHHEDAKLVQNVIPAILKKYPNVHFYVTSMFSYFFSLEEFKDRIHLVPWINLKTWPEDVCALGLDIGLAPLVDNFFNRAKSNLRFLEYSAARMATVASPVEPYKCIQHNKTGLLATSPEEWIEYISKLVEDKELRNRIATNANKYVSKNFDIKRNAKNTLKIYQRIIKDFKRQKGKPTQLRNPLPYGTSSIA